MTLPVHLIGLQPGVSYEDVTLRRFSADILPGGDLEPGDPELFGGTINPFCSGHVQRSDGVMDICRKLNICLSASSVVRFYVKSEGLSS